MFLSVLGLIVRMYQPKHQAKLESVKNNLKPVSKRGPKVFSEKIMRENYKIVFLLAFLQNAASNDN